MTSRNTSDMWLSIGMVLLACFLLFIWIPLDTETGIIEKVRSQVTIGDALAPSVAAAVIVFGGLLLLLQSWLGRASDDSGLSVLNLKFLAGLLLIVVVSFTVMRWAGPLLTPLLTGSDDPDIYRKLRDTLPWKYIGYLSGGFLLVFGLMTLIVGRFRWLYLLIALLATLILALVYDLPFDSLQLPPNGDV